MTARAHALGLAVAMAGILVALAKPGEHTVDDAFILFRYADSLASGQGLTWNPGERVEGYSSLCFVLLLSLGKTLGIPHVLASNVLNLLGVGVACLGAFHAARAVLSPRMPPAALPGAVAAGLLVALHDGPASYGLLGMEAAMAAGFLAMAMLLRLREQACQAAPWRSGLAFGLLAITRPEGGLAYAMSVLAFLGAEPWRRELARGAAAVSLPLAQLVFRIAYYGELLPNTFHAKIWAGADRWSLGGAYVAGYLIGLGPALLGILGLGTLAPPARCGVALLALLAAGGLFFGLYSGGDLYTSHRFLVPTHPAVAALLGSGLGALASRAGRSRWPALVGLLALAVATGQGFQAWRRAVLPLSTLPARLAANATSLHVPTETLQVRVGRFLGAELPEDAWLTLGDCGRIPWYSGLRVVDSLGLMDAAVARSPGRKDGKLAAAYLLERDTDYYLLRLADLRRYPAIGGLPVDHRLAQRPAFHARRELRAHFPFGATGYFLFAREQGILADLAAEARRAALPGVVALDVPPAVSPGEARAVVAELEALPFRMLPAGGSISRRARFLWPTAAVELRPGGVLAATAPAPATLELGIAEPSAVVSIADASGSSRDVAGRDLLVTLPVPAGKITLTLASGTRATLLSPRLRAR